MRPTFPLTDFLSAWGQGDPGALDAVVTELYGFLRGRAHQALRYERQGHLFQTTDLLHELYLKLREMHSIPPSLSGEGQSHFVRLSARIMRHILVDYARMADAGKRGGQTVHVALEFAELPQENRTLDILILEEVLTKLESIDPKLLELVELRFFVGMTVEEVAEARRVHKSTVQREWRLAKRFLTLQLSEKKEEESHA